MLRLTKTNIAIPALIVLLAAVAGGTQVWSQHEARLNLDTALASLPAGSVGHYDRMAYNAFTRTVRISGLTITNGGHPALRMQEVVLHHLSGDGTPKTPFQASAVRLENVSWWRAGHSVTAALVQAVDVAALAAGVPPPPGLPTWLVAPGSGTLLAAGTITANGISDDEGATLSAVSIAGYVAGRIQTASANGFADRQGNRIASASAAGVDLDGLDAVFDTSRYTPDAPRPPTLSPLIGHAEVAGFQSEGASGRATIQDVSLDGLAARPFATAPNSHNVKSWDFARDAAASVSLQSAAVVGLRFEDSQTKADGTLKALSVSGYADGALAQASLDGLALTGGDRTQVTIGHFALTGLSATKLLDETAANSGLSVVEAATSGAVRLAGLTLDTVAVKPPAGAPITLQSLDQTVTGSAPQTFTLHLRGLTMPAHSNPELAQGLGALGVDPLSLDLDETGTYDAASGQATLKPMVLNARGLGSLSLSAEFSGLPHDLPLQGLDLSAFNSTGIGPFTLTFTNDGLVGRVIAMQARQANKTPEEITDEAKLAGSFAAAALVPGQADAGDQIAAFVADPRVLTLTATPVAPVPLGDFLGPNRDAAKGALNLRISGQ